MCSHAVYVVIAVYSVGAVVGLFCLLSPLVALIPLMTNIRSGHVTTTTGHVTIVAGHVIATTGHTTGCMIAHAIHVTNDSGSCDQSC